jgi:kynurenine formamidase
MKKTYLVTLLIIAPTLLLALAYSQAGQSKAPDSSTLLDIYKILKSKTYVDLTHAFGPGIPHWPGFPDEKRETLYYYDEGVGSQGSGFFAQRYTIVGQWGTHVDPPAHFTKGLRTVDEIDVKEMILPLVVIDVHEAVAANPDYTLQMKDIENWEKKFGSVPEGAFVAMRTDWSKRWPDAAKMRNEDTMKVAHYPGWSLDVLKYLYEKKKITASGHETTDTDPGIAASKDDFSLETYILSQNHWQIELICNLDKIPESGALVVATFPKPKKGSGFPARLFAILP